MSLSLDNFLIILGLGLITLVSRSFFFIPKRQRPLPPWMQQGLLYAPIAALAAVIFPEILLKNGLFNPPWQEARAWAAIAGLMVYLWRKDVLLTIIAGMMVYLPLHLGLGW